MVEEREKPKAEEAEYQVDIDKIPVTTTIVELKQEGNYLVGVTETGVRFKQRIPQGKILNKVDDKWILEDIKIAPAKKGS